jgi:hypothetical protein
MKGMLGTALATAGMFSAVVRGNPSTRAEEDPMTKRTVLATAAAAAALIAGVGTIAASSDDDHEGRERRRLRAELRGFNEVATVSSAGRGSFAAVISPDDTSIEYHLRFTGLEAPVLMSHIHFGDHHTAGGISVWLCGTATNPGPAGTPLCADPTADPTSGDVTGTLTAAQVVGPAGQGIAAGEFDELVRAIRAGVTYVNVHSTKFPTGEIRGGIRVH